jgi:S-DNA-T family DNA segregation ATPase FtsK/SpoIIIE
MVAYGLRDCVPSGVGGALGNVFYRDFFEIILGNFGSLLLISILYAFCLLGLFVDNPHRYIAARIRWFGDFLKQNFGPHPRRASAQAGRRRQVTAAVPGRQQPPSADAEGKSGTAADAAAPAPSGEEVPGGIGDVSIFSPLDDLPDASSHAFLTDPLGPVPPEFIEPVGVEPAANTVTPGEVPDVIAGVSSEDADSAGDPEESDLEDASEEFPVVDDGIPSYDDFSIPETSPEGAPATGDVVVASVLAATARPAAEGAGAKKRGRAAKDAAPPSPDSFLEARPEASGAPVPAFAGDSPAAPPSAVPGGLRIIEAEVVERAVGSLEPKKRDGYQPPLISLLKEPPPPDSGPQENYAERAERLITTLAEFKIKAEMGEIQSGPVITRYEVIPAPGVRVEKIAGLANNLAMNLKAESVRVLAPVPGKGTVGIEVPNQRAKAVSLREIIESKAWEKNKHEIPVVLGKDVTGKPIIENLAKMPHCLIAGSTGSGKSVCINGIVASLVYHAGPEDLRFIMVDPKVVELQVYNKLPHMLIPVVTDPKMVPFALTWLIKEMEKRYKIFAKTGVKNIAGFNAKLSKSRVEAELARQLDLELSPEERAAAVMADVPRDEGVLEIPERKLPYIVCFIDELADLMMVAPAEIETGIARLAQLARAAGIHLILATQRPSVNVITGIIKANLPTRIAFKVTSQIDSRTILDQKGAETLIGRGDMLFIPPGGSHLVRAQGAYVSEEEIEAIVEHLALCNGEPEFDDEVQDMISQMADEAAREEAGGDMEATEGTDDTDSDPMIAKSWELIRTTKKVSTSFLQRKLSIGYGRAAKIIDTLEERGYIGPDRGPGNQRDILRD